MGFFIPTFHWFAFLSYAFDATVCVMLIDFINRTLDILLINIDRRSRQSSTSTFWPRSCIIAFRICLP